MIIPEPIIKTAKTCYRVQTFSDRYGWLTINHSFDSQSEAEAYRQREIIRGWKPNDIRVSKIG